MVSAETSRAFSDAIVIDGCSFFATRWTERQEISGVTALQMTVPMTWSGAREAFDYIHRLLDLTVREPRFTIIESTADIEAAKASGQVGFIIGAQNAMHFEYDARLVDEFYRAGMRVTQLAYNERNLLGDGCLETTNVGLSKFGEAIVKRMNAVGMQIDLSHTGERTTLDAIAISEKPCIFSHCNPKARADNPRNITDEQIKLCAEAGGVVGLTSYAPLVWMGGGAPSLDDFIGHIEYTVDLVGIDAVSLGSDSEATPGAYPAFVTKRLATDYPDAGAPLKKAHPGVRKTNGIESMEDFPKLATALQERGWDDEAIRKLFGGNLLRVYKANWGA